MKQIFKVLTASAITLSLSATVLLPLPNESYLSVSHAQTLPETTSDMTSTNNTINESEESKDIASTDDEMTSLEEQLPAASPEPATNESAIDSSNTEVTEQQPDEALPSAPNPSQPSAEATEQVVIPPYKPVLTGKDKYQFTRNSNQYTHNGMKLSSNENVVVVNGTTYVQFKTIANAYGFTVTYNQETKETIAKDGHNVIKFKIDTSIYSVNGKNKNAGGNSFVSNGSLMIPIRAWATATGSVLQVKGEYISLQWNSTPTANFKVNEAEIVTNETEVTTTSLASSPMGYAIVDEQWEGLQKYYSTPGEYTITRKVQDERGVWSEPFSLKIKVLAPNKLPIADFIVNKASFKIGEPVVYTNLSKDPDGQIVRTIWTGNDPAFFEAGTYTIKLMVQDDRKGTQYVEKDIVVTDEIMYTKEQFYLNFAKMAQKIPINPGLSLTLPNVNYSIDSRPVTGIRGNSPEQIRQPAIDYTDVLSGEVRFSIHKQNQADRRLEVHLVATNENEFPITVSKNLEVIGGPSLYVTDTGKKSVSRYLEAKANPKTPELVTLEPGESTQLFDTVLSMAPGHTISQFSEYYSDSPVRYTLVVTESKGDPIAEMASLQQTDIDGVHIRGTFWEADRDIYVNKVLGQDGPEKMIFGDKDQTYDRYLYGYDAITGAEVVDRGNFTVLYNLNLSIAPNTAVILNPRGGHYGGAFSINGEIVEVTDTSILLSNQEAGFIYRTGHLQEDINIKFITAPGSNMPFHLMFLPLPSLKDGPDYTYDLNGPKKKEAETVTEQSTDDMNNDSDQEYND